MALQLHALGYMQCREASTVSVSKCTRGCSAVQGRAFSSQATLPDPSQLLFEEAALETLLGKGSFGCVFRATWRQQEVALKVGPSAPL